MPTITRLPLLPLRRLRAEPNQLILHFRSGKIVRKGAGMAYWFSPLSAAIAMLPIEDCQSTFVLNEHSADFQPIKVQSTISYRIIDAEKAASRFNFSLSIDSGAWPLYRFDPGRFPLGEPPLQLDSGPPRERVETLLQAEARFRMVEKQDPERFKHLIRQAQEHARNRYAIYEQLAGIAVPRSADGKED